MELGSVNHRILALSHINIIVDDVARATEFYRKTLGFEIAENDDGPMDYQNVTMDTFARNAGFLDESVTVDVRFLKHPSAGILLELMHYHTPVGKQLATPNTNDQGGVRHIALEVENIHDTFEYLSSIEGVQMINPSKNYGPPELLTPFPISFFYWIDPWGVQWEMECGRPIGEVKGVVG